MKFVFGGVATMVMAVMVFMLVDLDPQPADAAPPVNGQITD